MGKQTSAGRGWKEKKKRKMRAFSIRNNAKLPVREKNDFTKLSSFL